MIVREFTDADCTLAVTVKCYPPSPTVWVWITFPWSGQEFEFDFGDTHSLRSHGVDWLAQWIKDSSGGGTAADFRVDLVRVLNEVDAEFAKVVGNG